MNGFTRPDRQLSRRGRVHFKSMNAQVANKRLFIRRRFGRIA